ncbi:MAG: hypothetical protein GTO51_02385 [Candidatus Latescibacteria bacterium]|nr:hypothetical protein [Candidatus Latescibacterota bacterium]NIM22508.1 hypothetical protein [Candidatus Latescibacterota bacterium]NIM64822.1 hypothetical protein [Candidatus Latescibacterota bacterium]NIO01330.1 hypothetical protein [Candidatus Latescibacterota bacterium]NIO27819.1 hypothetical protein [Candidatus Latescibacterota bacterium]
MAEKDDTLYYVMPEGKTQEETWSWSDIVDLCKSGRLSSESRIYLPEEKAWKRAIDTDLGTIFESLDGSEQRSPEEDVETVDSGVYRQAYEDACQELRRTPDVPRAYLNAASAALALEDRQAAIRHYQEALELWPFNRQIASGAKRSLRREEWRLLKLLDRPAPFWEDLWRVVTFPITGGLILFPLPGIASSGVLARIPFQFILPALALSILAAFPYFRIAAAGICYLWVYQAILRAASGETHLPGWGEFISTFVQRILKPVFVGLMLAAELYLPFFIIAEAAILIGASSRPDVFQFVQNSALMVVLMWALGLLYLPVALAISVSPGVGLKVVLNPKKVIPAIITMEHEYLATALFNLVVVLAWGFSRLAVGSLPFLGIFLPVFLTIYAVQMVGFVLGRLSTRYQHLWMDGTK